MTYYAHINTKNNKVVSTGQCKMLNDNILNLQISEDIFSNFETDKYLYQNGEIVINTEFEQIKLDNKIAEFKQMFFETSLGWVSRHVHMQNGEVRQFLFDILPVLVVDQLIITYELPTLEGTKQNTNVLVTEQFLLECKQQIQKDFYGN